jgi:hypothetical protein
MYEDQVVRRMWWPRVGGGGIGIGKEGVGGFRWNGMDVEKCEGIALQT